MAQWEHTSTGLILPRGVQLAKALQEAKQDKVQRGRFFSNASLMTGNAGPGYTKPADTLPFEMLRQARDKSLIDKIIIMARITQMKWVARRVVVPGKQVGFRIVHQNHADPNYKPDEDVIRRCKEMERIIENVNEEIHPGGFRDFGAIAVDQELTYDRKCFPYDTVLETDLGPMWIGKIVQHKLPVKIKSIDLETGDEVWGQVTDWQIIRGVKEWVRLRFDGGQRYRSLVVTPDHEIWTNRGMVPAEKLSTDDILYVSGARPSDEQNQLILGSILGDGFINVRKNALPKFGIGHSIKQQEYLEWKFNSLENFKPGMTHRKTRAYVGGEYHESMEFRTSGSNVWYEYIDKCYESGKRKIKWEWLKELDELGLAIWIMDDGTIQSGSKVNAINPVCSLVVHADDEEIDVVRRYFEERWNLTPRFDGKRQSKSDPKSRVWVLNFRKDETQSLLKIISMYVSYECEGRKIHKKWIAKEILPFGKNGLIPAKLKAIERFKATSKKQTSYDVTVSPTHTIVAHHLVTSNCMVITRDRTGAPIRYHLVDGTTVRSVLDVLIEYMDKHNIKRNEKDAALYGYYRDTGVDLTNAAFVQVVDGLPVASWTKDEMSIDITNPSVEINKWAYGAGSHLEQSIAASISFMQAWQYNDGLFNQDSPESLLMLYGDYDPVGLGAFQRQILDQSGSGDYQKIPVITADEGFKADLIKIRELPKDIQFPELMRIMIQLKTAAYRAHPSIVNFSIDQGSGGGLSIGNNSEDEIVQHAHEEGFETLCYNICTWLTRTIIKPRYDDLVMIMETDTENEQKLVELIAEQQKSNMTFNEGRRASGRTGDLPYGDVPDNANYIQWATAMMQLENQQKMMQAQQENVNQPQSQEQNDKKNAEFAVEKPNSDREVRKPVGIESKPNNSGRDSKGNIQDPEKIAGNDETRHSVAKHLEKNDEKVLVLEFIN